MSFPVVDAFLLCPEEGKRGKIAICTNTLAPSMVSNEIPLDLRGDLAVMGSLVVNRDGCERMIVNALAHPTVEYIILFGQETLSFCPSTNLLCALMDGYRKDKSGNFITGGRGVAHHYPSVSEKLLTQFRSRFKVLPLFKHHASDEIVEKYMEWIKDKIPADVHGLVNKIIGKKKIYYDSLTELVKLLQKKKASSVSAVQLDPKDFQHLQPPIIELEERPLKLTKTHFSVDTDGDEIVVKLDVKGKGYELRGLDSWLIACSLQKFLEKNKVELPPKHQLLIGYELSRAEMKIKNSVNAQTLIKPELTTGKREKIEYAQRLGLIADKEYYYKMGIKDDKVSVQSLAHDTCKSVFELRSKSILAIIDKLAEENRFQDYSQQILHRIDVGIEVSRAAIALGAGYSYFQDFRSLFKINKTDFPLLFVEGDSFLGVHQKLITALYTRGLTTSHPDAHKGTMRSATLLAAYRRSPETLKHFPEIYASGTLSAKEMREQYKKQLQSPHNEGTYTYGSRTRAHFGHDQLDRAAQELKKNPNKTAIVQRFDMEQDMTIKETPITDDHGEVVRTRLEATKDPCLTHDIYFVHGGKLHSFHIARAHNIVNAYPENIFGLFDAYDKYISEKIGIELGDMFVLSSRGNILLLTEEQKAKKLIAEPAKPASQMDKSLGPTDLRYEFPAQGIGHFETLLEENKKRPEHPDLDLLESYNRRDIVDAASNYLKKRGSKHNNPIMGTFDPKDPDTSGRLAFMQCNDRGGKIQMTAVFIDGTKDSFVEDASLCNYVATQFKTKLKLPLGKLNMFYVPIRE